MQNKIVFSKEVIDNYKNNIDLLESLKVSIKSGACSVYDMALYNALVNANKEPKTLVNTMNKI